MPKYTFKCQKCGASIQKYVSVSTRELECECGQSMSRAMPNLLGSPKVTETVDKLTNKKHIDDQANEMKDRKSHHYWSVEVPKMVNSGIYSIETMVEQGWIYLNEKEEVVIRNKSPEKS